MALTITGAVQGISRSVYAVVVGDLPQRFHPHAHGAFAGMFPAKDRSIILPIRIEIAQAIERTVSTKAQIRPFREEIASTVIQGGAAVVSAVGLVYLVTRAWPQHNGL